MPNTQQQWLADRLCELDTTPYLTLIQTHVWAAALVRAWPSSPQGLAAKALAEALKCLTDLYRMTYSDFAAKWGDRRAAQTVGEIVRDGLEAARKAGI